MLTCKITFVTHPTQELLKVVKIKDFGHFISLDRINSVFSLNLINTKNMFFSGPALGMFELFGRTGRRF